MGYPNKRVSMTSVHGEPQQGGRLPADIWHAYMSAVTEHQACVPFRSSGEAISFKPFFGKLSSTGRSESPFGEGGPSKELPVRKHPSHARSHSRGAPRGGGLGERHTTPRRAAPAAPQRAPKAAPGNPGGGGPTVNRTGGAGA